MKPLRLIYPTRCNAIVGQCRSDQKAPRNGRQISGNYQRHWLIAAGTNSPKRRRVRLSVLLLHPDTLKLSVRQGVQLINDSPILFAVSIILKS